MKKFLLLLPLLSAFALPTSVEANWFGKYGSEFEALQACMKWSEKGGVFYTWHPADESLGLKERTGKYRMRWCEQEEETNKWLGINRINVNVKKGETYRRGKDNLAELVSVEFKNKKVIKRFKY